MISEAMFTRTLELMQQQGNHIGHILAPRRHPLGFVRHAFRNPQGRHVCGEANVDCATRELSPFLHYSCKENKKFASYNFLRSLIHA